MRAEKGLQLTHTVNNIIHLEVNKTGMPKINIPVK